MEAEVQFLDFLDAISGCFTDRNFAAWRARILLPFSLITRDRPILLDTEAALRANFDQYLVACAVLKIDLIYRRRVSLEPAEDGTWIGTYETSLLSGGKRATPAYLSSALLETMPDGMKMRSILNARGHRDWTGQSG